MPTPAPRSGSSPSDVLVLLKRSGRGGVERIALRLAAGWRDAGLTVAMAVTPTGRAVPEWREMLQLFVTARREIRRSRPQIVFVPGNAYTVVAILLKLLLGRACPRIVAKVSNDLVRRDMPPGLRPLYRLWLRLQGLLLDDFVALSPAMAAEIAALTGVPANRVHVLANPVLSDEDAGAPIARLHAVPGGGRRFAAVGRLEPQKRFAHLLRAFAAGSALVDTLTIFGEGREAATLTRLADELGIGARVEFAGYCDDVRGELARHDALLLSSAFEGLPGALIEALSVGIWVVATRCCASMPDLLDHGRLGSIVEVDDGAGFASAIAAVEPGRQDSAGARTKAFGYTLEAAVPAYLALFARAAVVPAVAKPAVVRQPITAAAA